MPDAPRILLVPDLAAAMRVSANVVRDRWKAWVREAHFPAPLPLGRALRWDAAAIDHWLKVQRGEAAPAAAGTPANDDAGPEAIVAARLAKRAAGGQA